MRAPNRRQSIAAVVLAAGGLVLARLVGRAHGDGPGAVPPGVAPGSAFYAVEHGGRLIGYASSTRDTARDGVGVTEVFVADFPVGGATHRVMFESRASLTRALALRDFTMSVASDSTALHATGHVTGDSVLDVVVRAADAAHAETQRLRLARPIVLPMHVPLALVLAGHPTVGGRYTTPVLDPLALGVRDATVRVLAESTLMVPDSARRDARTGRWTVAHAETLRAWRLAFGGAGGFDGWIDAQGWPVVVRQAAGFTLRRMPSEVVLAQWRGAQRGRAPVGADRDILETTAIAANVPLRGAGLGRLRVRLANVDLARYDVAGGRQALSHDTLTITREPQDALRAPYTLREPGVARDRFAEYLRAEPLLQARDPRIAALAARLAATAAAPADPGSVAEHITRWVARSVKDTITVMLPNAVQVLRTLRGDCNEHAQLATALARAAGIPARTVAGLAYIGGKFYYHAWLEVYLGGWVAADPELGQFPADAAHLRFVIGGIERQAELLGLIGRLTIDVVD